MNNRYISIKLEDSLLEKLARYFVASLPEIRTLAELTFSIGTLEPATQELYAVAMLPENIEMNEEFFDDLDGFDFLENLKNFKILEKNCEFQNLILTKPSSWKAEISRTLLVINSENFEAIADSLYKSFSWDEFSKLSVAFLHLPKKLQPRMFDSPEFACIMLNRDTANLMKLPAFKSLKILEFCEQEAEKYEGVFVRKGEKPLLLRVLHEQLQKPDEITFLGNAKPPISIKLKQFKPMSEFISFDLPEIIEPKAIDDFKIDIDVNAYLVPDTDYSTLDEIDYVGIRQHVLNAYFDDFQNAIELKTLKYQVFPFTNNENLILFDKRLITEFSSLPDEIKASAILFRKLTNKVSIANSLEFKPKPETSWFETEFASGISNSVKVLLLPEASKIKELTDLRKREIYSEVFRKQQQLKSINVMKIGQNWLPAEDLIYTLNPKLGEMLEKQHQTSLDRIKSPKNKKQ